MSDQQMWFSRMYANHVMDVRLGIYLTVTCAYWISMTVILAEMEHTVFQPLLIPYLMMGALGLGAMIWLSSWTRNAPEWGDGDE